MLSARTVGHRPTRAALGLTVALAAAVPAPVSAAAEPTGPTSFPDLPLPPTPPSELTIVKELRTPRGRAAHLALLTREAGKHGLPPDVADAVASVESAYDPAAVGRVGELGLMQVRPTTAAMLGHRGAATELFNPETNVRYGVAYLARAWDLAGGDLCRALMKYRAGHGEERMTPLSVDYCRRARTHLAAVGSALASAPLPAPSPATAGAAVRSPSATGSVPSTPLQTTPPRPDPMQARRVAEAQRLWAEHVARVRKIEMRIEGVMSSVGG